MKGKIILITPPDFFENENTSILFINLSDKDQSLVSDWFANSELSINLNIYFFDKETDVPWLLHAVSRCEFKFIDLDNTTELTRSLSGFILAKNNTFYSTDNIERSSVFSYINQNKITNIEKFLEKAFNVKGQ